MKRDLLNHETVIFKLPLVTSEVAVYFCLNAGCSRSVVSYLLSWDYLVWQRLSSFHLPVSDHLGVDQYFRACTSMTAYAAGTGPPATVSFSLSRELHISCLCFHYPSFSIVSNALSTTAVTGIL